MQRLQQEGNTVTEGENGRPETIATPDLHSGQADAQPEPVAAPRLLLERESAYRVFLWNLTDLILSRTPIPVATTSDPAPFWNEVFVRSSVPWRRFVESLLGHMIVVTALLIMVPKWPSGPIQQRSVFDKSYVSYYTPPKSFPALRSNSARVRPKANRQPVQAHQPTIRVAPEHSSGNAQGQDQKAAMTLPPDLISSKPGRLKLPASQAPSPMMPLSATGNSHLASPAGPTWVVAPPSDSGLPTARGSGLLQATAVAPAPEMSGVSARRGIATTPGHGTIIAPPPSVSDSMRRAGDINIGESAVVQPAPSLPMSAQSTAGVAKGTLGGFGGVVVPPPPSVQSSGTLSGGRASLLAGSGSQVVPPTPSVQSASNLAGNARGGGFSPAGVPVVPPTPLLQGAGNTAGNGRGGSLLSGLQAVPPAPTVPGAGNLVGSGRAGGVSGGLQPVPPAPSIDGEGTGTGNGRGGSSSAGTELAGAGSPGMPPSAQGTGSITGASALGDGASFGQGAPTALSSAAAGPHEPATIEVPLHLIAPVLALPGSSYFSNYEVFIAERKLANRKRQLIKLVYVSLPYQRRLSEYDPSDWMVAKLRITRDQSCDEGLMQMTWPETDPRPAAQPSADSPALSSGDRNEKLPCYRTTADDYRRAVSHKR
jgi:hypothetical protein